MICPRSGSKFPWNPDFPRVFSTSFVLALVLSVVGVLSSTIAADAQTRLDNELVFQAARERTGTYVIGSNSDQNAVAPTVTLGSVVIDLPEAFLVVAREVKAGTFQPRVVTFDARSNIVRLVVNPSLAPRIPARTTAALDSVTRRIHDGSFTTTR